MYILNDGNIYKDIGNEKFLIKNIYEELATIEKTVIYKDFIKDFTYIRTEPEIIVTKKITKNCNNYIFDGIFGNEITDDIFLTVQINGMSKYNNYLFDPKECFRSGSNLIMKNSLKKGDVVTIYKSKPLKNVLIYLENEKSDDIFINYNVVKIIGKNFLALNGIKYRINGLVENKVVNFMKIPSNFETIRIFENIEGIEHLLSKESNFIIKYGGIVILKYHKRISILGKNVGIVDNKVMLPIYVNNYIVLIENNIAKVMEKNNTYFKLNKKEGEVSFILEAIVG